MMGRVKWASDPLTTHGIAGSFHPGSIFLPSGQIGTLIPGLLPWLINSLWQPELFGPIFLIFPMAECTPVLRH